MSIIRHKRFLPLVVFFIACSFIVSLLFTIKPDVFFSGDAGLKMLVIKQINNTGEFKTLQIQQPEWVQKIWQQGFYPFKAPFVYDFHKGKTVAFPPAFQWLNAPFYQWFGYRGMYIIPSLSLVLLWFWFSYTLRRIVTNVYTLSSGLFIMALCSPLTIYAATYWEHTLGVLLLFAGVVFLVRKPQGYLQSQLLGIITGLATWFRPEAMVLSALIVAVTLYNYSRDKKLSQLFFVMGFMLVLIPFFVFNAIEYGSLLGAHAYQFVDRSDTSSGLQRLFVILSHINTRFLIFFPAAIVFYILAGYLVIKRPALPSLIYQLVIIAVLYSLLTPFILPNAGGKQWGPRYFLPLIPLMLITICVASNYISVSKKLIYLVIPLVVYSCYVNVYKAATTLADDYAYRVTPGMNFLKSTDCKIVVVQNQFIAQEFAAAFSSKTFFLAEDEANFFLLIGKLRQAGVSRIIYMDINDRARSMPGCTQAPTTPIGNYYFTEYSLK